MDPLGVRIRARREELKLSQAELAAAIGMSQAAVSRLESSEKGTSDFRLLTRIAKALKQRVSDYISEDPGLGLEMFSAFCPNPFCRSNKHKQEHGVISVYWNSWESYPVADFNGINYCPHCGTDLVKDCAQCSRIFPQRESKYCIRCGEEICNRPTAEEWESLKKLYAELFDGPPPPRPVDEDIPF